MRSRILYLLRFALVVLLSFLVLKGCFLLLVPAEGALNMGDIFAVLYHGLSLDFSVLGYLLVIPLLTTAVSCFFRAFPARRTLRPYHILTAALISIVGITDVRLYPFWGFKLDASIFLYLDQPGEAFASVSLPFITSRSFSCSSSAYLLASPSTARRRGAGPSFAEADSTPFPSSSSWVRPSS